MSDAIKDSGKRTAAPTCNEYTVGWVCALPKEQTAATAMLDHTHPKITKPPNDTNSYTLGSIGKHNVVIACLPKGKIGNNAAATAATQMVRTFPSIKVGLMVGIGGGVPPKVRLGDVVISAPVAEFPGVVQWDLGKAETGGSFRRTGALDKPPNALLTALTQLESQHDMNGSKIPKYLDALKDKYPKMAAKYTWSNFRKDPLSSPDESQEKPEDIRVHYGLIASGDQVIKDAAVRDKLNESLGGNVLCFEMEAAGLMDNFPCLVIRGICDYADSQKNEDWQEYAAAVAAACTKEILEYVESSDIDGACLIQDILNDVKTSVQRTELNIRRIESNMDRAGRIEVLNWLTPFNYGPQHSDFIKIRQPQTGEWFLYSPGYKNWRDQEKQILLCKGIPGAGKTIIAATVIDNLMTKFYDDDSTGLAYIYFNFRRQHEQELENLLASLIKQLSQTMRVLPEKVTKLHTKHEEKNTRPSVDELSEALLSTVKIYSKVFIVIDALDECHIPDGRLSRFLSEVFYLQKKSAVNVLATSRPIPEIEMKFQGHPSKNISASEEDIRKYIDNNLTRIPSFALEYPTLQELIKTEIVAAAGGVFLLARLHFDSILGKRSRTAINAALKNLPTGSNAYDHAYNEAMVRIQGQHPEARLLAERILAWISCARRPLATSELQHALAVEHGKTELDKENITPINIMLSDCAGLVAVDESSNIVRLVHYTTQEYFERKRRDLFPNAEAEITRDCLTYLLFHSFDAGPLRTLSDLDSRLQKHKLYDYSANNWGRHAREASKVAFDPIIMNFLKTESKFKASSQAQFKQESLYPWSSLRNVHRTSLHLAALFGLEEAATNLLQDNVNIDASDFFSNTPLALATKNGHERMVELLLDKKANPELTEDYGCTPLLLAIIKKHEPIVKLLLKYGARVEGGSRFGTAEYLPLALAGANGNGYRSKERLLGNPLSLAALHGREGIVRMLLENGANVEGDRSGNCFLSTPLSLAVQEGHEGIVKMLLDHGAKVDVKTYHTDITPLLWATKNPLIDGNVIRHLLENGPDLNFKDKDGRTALLWAAETGNATAVQLLLERGADPTLKDKLSGLAPLALATQHGNEAVVRMFLNENTDIEIKDRFDRTPLSWAARNGFEAVVKLLLDKGVDLEEKDSGGGTPLSWASGRHEGVVKLLLDKQTEIKLKTVA
ncbi:hypothetical protein N7533_008961 [Penicillium manginii]|uniref:uncharacterized protein n=1 Tax=Penicillium manginii TaxID=203109 RepID=UPI0025465AEC|nr:uncharacterized protein N7533_008961 [Penicillium manginii]KAJ5744091.1 hypothetical protein N7533_008961 [Penicillium manginii]